MRYHLASNDQLTHIFNHEKDCPADVLSGVVREMTNREMLNGYVKYIIKKTFYNEKDIEDLLQIGLIVMNNKAKDFKPGRLKPKNYMMMCIRSKYLNLYQKQNTTKRGGDVEIITGEDLETYLLESPMNVERYVLNKIEIEECLSGLKDYQQKIFIMRSQGYTYDEIASEVGHSSGKVTENLYRRLRKQLREELSYAL